MPTARVTPDLDMHYLIDDYTDPWRPAEAILLLHGIAESGAVWFAWVPHIARHFRVVRPDMRGYGDSTPMPRDFPWSLDIVIEDFAKLMHTLGFVRFHVVGAKFGATVARRLAARYPERVRTLTLAGAPPPHFAVEHVADRIEECEKQGVGAYARRTMLNRLGSRFPPEAVEWYAKLMGRTPISSQVGFIAKVPSTDISSDLPHIICPTLVITTEGSALGSIEETHAWQQKIPRSELLVLPGDSYHVAASDADHCARKTIEFVSRFSSSAS